MENEIKDCGMCVNAFTDPDLNSDNDLSYFTIGECEKGYRMLLRSGDGRPTTILVEKWIDGTGWITIGDYQPRYCPNCGRELKENAPALPSRTPGERPGGESRGIYHFVDVGKMVYFKQGGCAGPLCFFLSMYSPRPIQARQARWTVKSKSSRSPYGRSIARVACGFC